jgi:ketosteroid isomerase-like protein
MTSSGIPREVPDCPLLHGRAAVVGWFRNVIDHFPDYRAEVEEVVDAGNGVFVVRYSGVGSGAASGVEAQFGASQVWRLRAPDSHGRCVGRADAVAPKAASATASVR